MIKVWDYFMRRKGILLLILAVFLASSILSYNVFRSQALDRPIEYISIRNWGGNYTWGDGGIEVPRTGGETPIVLAILRPDEVTSLSPRSDEVVSLAPRPEDVTDHASRPDEATHPASRSEAEIAQNEDSVTDPLNHPTEVATNDNSPANSSDHNPVSDPLNPAFSAGSEETLPGESESDGVNSDSIDANATTSGPDSINTDSTDSDPANTDPNTADPANNDSDSNATDNEPEFDPESSAQNPDIPETKAGNEPTSEQDLGYLVFLVVIGLIVAGFGTYFLEQHFWR